MSKTPDGYVEMSLGTFIEVLQAITPSPGRIAELTDVPIDLLKAIMEYAKEGEVFDTDPDVGIFGADPDLLTDMQLALVNEMRCPNCSGQGMVWDDTEYKKHSTWAIVHSTIPMPEDGYVQCPTCKGEARVKPDEWREFYNPTQVIGG